VTLQPSFVYIPGYVGPYVDLIKLRTTAQTDSSNRPPAVRRRRRRQLDLQAEVRASHARAGADQAPVTTAGLHFFNLRLG
jgi:hypothetical protein